VCTRQRGVASEHLRSAAMVPRWPASREPQRLHDLLEEVLAHELGDLAHNLVEARAWLGLGLG